jgi:hypothetical protein
LATRRFTGERLLPVSLAALHEVWDIMQQRGDVALLGLEIDPVLGETGAQRLYDFGVGFELTQSWDRFIVGNERRNPGDAAMYETLELEFIELHGHSPRLS